jgi:hypothetical protein
MSTNAAVPPLSGEQERWHYAFAHHVLRVACFEEREFTLSALAAPESAQRFVLAAMALIGRHFKLSVEQVMALARSITVVPCRFGDDGGYVFEMPAPRKTAECFFLAIVRNRDGGIGYYTLERSPNGGAMLCAWNAEGAHLNYGERGALDRDGFVAEIAALRSRSQG